MKQEQEDIKIIFDGGVNERVYNGRLPPGTFLSASNVRISKYIGAMEKAPGISTKITYDSNQKGVDTGTIFHNKEVVNFKSFGAPQVWSPGDSSTQIIKRNQYTVTTEGQCYFSPAHIEKTLSPFTPNVISSSIAVIEGSNPIVVAACYDKDFVTKNYTVVISAYTPDGVELVKRKKVSPPSDDNIMVEYPLRIIPDQDNNNFWIQYANKTNRNVIAVRYLSINITNLESLSIDTDPYMVYSGSEIAQPYGYSRYVKARQYSSNNVAFEYEYFDQNGKQQGSSDLQTNVFSGSGGEIAGVGWIDRDNFKFKYSFLTAGNTASEDVMFRQYRTEVVGTTPIEEIPPVTVFTASSNPIAIGIHTNVEDDKDYIIALSCNNSRQLGGGFETAYTDMAIIDPDSDNSGSIVARARFPNIRLSGRAISVPVTGSSDKLLDGYKMFWNWRPYYGDFDITTSHPNFVSDPFLCVSTWGPRYNITGLDSVLLPEYVARLADNLHDTSPAEMKHFNYQPMGYGVTYENSTDKKNLQARLYATTRIYTDGAKTKLTEILTEPAHHDVKYMPRFVEDEDDVTYVAGAFPIIYDGQFIFEMSPQFRPFLASSTNGSGSNLTNGVYGYIGTFTYRDAAGNVHRSAPSLSITQSYNGSEAGEVWSSTPMSYWDGNALQPPQFNLYATEADGTIYYFVTSSYTSNNFDNTSNHLYSIPETSIELPIVYSDGTATDAIPAVAPPPLYEIASVGYRLFGIDAENRSRVVYTKNKVKGISYEWGEGFEINLPAGAGKAYSIAEFNSTPIILCENGVYTVDGQGPNDLGVGFYGAPRRIGDIGAISNWSVTTPVGVFFLSGRGPALFSGQTRWIDQVKMEENGEERWDLITSIVHNKNSNEVIYWRGEDRRAYVYNYVKEAWVTWDNDITSEVSKEFSDGTIVFSNGTYSSGSNTGSLDITSGWIALPDYETDSYVDKIIFSAGNTNKTSGTGLEFTFWHNFNETTSSVHTFTSTSIATSTTSSYFTVHVTPIRKQSKAFKFRIRDTNPSSSGSIEPSQLTIKWSSNGNENRRLGKPARK